MPGLSISAAPDSDPVAAARALGISIRTGMTIASTEGRGRVHSARLTNGADIIPCDTHVDVGRLDAIGAFSPASRAAACVRSAIRHVSAVGGCRRRMCRRFRSGVLPARRRRSRRSRGTVIRGRGHTGDGTLRTAGPAGAHRKAFVDFQNDVTTKDLAIATAEGFVAIEHVKRYTTTGMATDQGKTSNMNAAGHGRGTDRPADPGDRPYDVPSALHAGDVRRTSPAPARGAVRPGAPDADRRTRRGVRRCRQLETRAMFPPRRRDNRRRRRRECLAVRNDVGMFDACTLGKIEVAGPDAAVFLTVSIPAISPGWHPVGADMPYCLGRMVSSATMASSPAWPPIVSMSPRRPAAPPSCCTTWKTTCKPNSPTCVCG